MNLTYLRLLALAGISLFSAIQPARTDWTREECLSGARKGRAMCYNNYKDGSADLDMCLNINADTAPCYKLPPGTPPPSPLSAPSPSPSYPSPTPHSRPPRPGARTGWTREECLSGARKGRAMCYDECKDCTPEALDMCLRTNADTAPCYKLPPGTPPPSPLPAPSPSASYPSPTYYPPPLPPAPGSPAPSYTPPLLMPSPSPTTPFSPSRARPSPSASYPPSSPPAPSHATNPIFYGGLRRSAVNPPSPGNRPGGVLVDPAPVAHSEDQTELHNKVLEMRKHLPQ
jgi:hypothetical protein